MLRNFIHIVFIFIVIFNLINCVSLNKYKEQLKEIERLDYRVYKLEKFLPNIEDLKKKKRKETVIKTILKHTSNSELKEGLGILENEKEEKQKEIEKIKGSKGSLGINREEKITKMEQDIDRIIDEEYEAIKKDYKIIIIDFVELKNVKILEKKVEILKKLRPEFARLCRSNKTIIIYGFGCYLGNKKGIKNISNLRAKAIANWITKSTDCRDINIRYDGLGIYLTKEDIKPFNKKGKELNRILAESRHAEIFIPKR